MPVMSELTAPGQETDGCVIDGDQMGPHRARLGNKKAIGARPVLSQTLTTRRSVDIRSPKSTGLIPRLRMHLAQETLLSPSYCVYTNNDDNGEFKSDQKT